ncbi:MAG: RidA family protein [Bdellovibrionaceae bacterium]|nr:RidA family protein [Pseudobdellovibrionaceae bacterium]
MRKEIIQTPKAPAAVGPYSQAVRIGDFLFCSGQIAIRPETNEVLCGSVEEQTEQVLKNIKAVLAAAGMTFENIVKTTIFLTDMNDFAKVNEIYARAFTSAPPARSTVAVSALPKGVNVEIEVIAHA